MDNVVATKTVDAPKGQPAIKGEGQHHAEKSKGDMPLENFEMENGKDYVYDAFEVGEKATDLPAEMNDKLTQISRHIKNLMKKEGYETTTKGFNSMLNKVKSSLGIDEDVTTDVTLDRIYGYIDAEKTLRSLKSINEESLLEKVRKAKNREEMTDIVMKEVGRYL